eukprot:363671-Chlamydomonas_euryale.AAC.5
MLGYWQKTHLGSCLHATCTGRLFIFVCQIILPFPNTCIHARSSAERGWLLAAKHPAAIGWLFAAKPAAARGWLLVGQLACASGCLHAAKPESARGWLLASKPHAESAGQQNN